LRARLRSSGAPSAGGRDAAPPSRSVRAA